MCEQLQRKRRPGVMARAADVTIQGRHGRSNGSRDREHRPRTQASTDTPQQSGETQLLCHAVCVEGRTFGPEVPTLQMHAVITPEATGLDDESGHGFCATGAPHSIEFRSERSTKGRSGTLNSRREEGKRAGKHQQHARTQRAARTATRKDGREQRPGKREQARKVLLRTCVAEVDCAGQ